MISCKKHVKMHQTAKSILLEETAKSFSRNLVSYKEKLNITNACKFQLMIQATSNDFSHLLRRIYTASSLFTNITHRNSKVNKVSIFQIQNM